MELVLMNSKPEIQDSLISVAEKYHKVSGTKIDIKLSTKSALLESLELESTGERGADIMMLQAWEMDRLNSEIALNLTNEPWVSEIAGTPHYTDGRIYGFPFCVEGKGLMVNVTAIERILGRDWDTVNCNSLSDLEELLEELDRCGMSKPVIISSQDWLFGGGIAGVIYEAQSFSQVGIVNMQQKLISDKMELNNNKRFLEFLNTLEWLNRYNINANNMDGDGYADDAKRFASGEAVMWFNGNWVWPNLKDAGGKDNEYDILPLFMNDDESDLVNQGIAVGKNRHLVIRSTVTEEQKTAALEFLQWLVYDEEGQHVMIDQLGLVPDFLNNTLEPSNDLNRIVKGYMDSGNTYPSSDTPLECQLNISGVLEDFLYKELDKNETADRFEDCWANISN